MASSSGSYQTPRQSSPPPNVASGSRSRNQESLERRHQSKRRRSRSRSPRDERWASNAPGGWNAQPVSGRSMRRTRTPPRTSRQRSTHYQHEDRYDRREVGREERDRNSRSPPVRRRRVERESEGTWRNRARSSPPAEATRRRSRSLSPQGYCSRQEGPVWQERDRQGRGMPYAHVGLRSQSSDASIKGITPPISQQDEHGLLGRAVWGGRQDQHPLSRDRDRSQARDSSRRCQVQGQTAWSNKLPMPDRGEAYREPPAQNIGAINNIPSAGNVFTGTNYGIVNMTIESANDFMLTLADRLKVCKRADHRYYAPEDEAALRRGQCTPGTHVNVLQGITHWAINMSPNGERVFWLSGQAGTGKTTIAYTIARHFETLVSDGNGKVILGASFFCSRQFPDTRSVSFIIRTIVYQLALTSKPFQTALQQHGRFETVDHGPRSQMMGLLITPWVESGPARLANNEPCYIIPLDALDELEGTGGTDFLGTLFDVVDKQDLAGLKFFVTSRSDPALVKRIASFPNKQVCRLEEVPLEESSADIKLFLRETLAECATPQQIQQLVSDAAGLFIYAATVIEYVKGRGVEEQKSLLRRLLSTSSPSIRRPSHAATASLDKLYLQILETCLVDPRERDDPEILQDCLSILHTFICTIERTSTSVAVDILNAGGGNSAMAVDVGMAEGVLHRLHAVLYSQSSQVMLYHKSFADFLFDQGRSQRFFCNQEQHHRRLANGCFRIMKEQLRFNIADIPSSYLMDRDNPTLPTNIENNISAPLRYACGNWSAHMTLTPVEGLGGLIGALHDFLRIQVLFWMEAMNLLGQRHRCQGMLRDAQRWSSKSKDPKELANKLSDAAAFAAYHSTSGAALSTPHLYLSSLATFSRRSTVVQTWRQQLGGIPGFLGLHGAAGEAAVTSINVKSNVQALAVSSDGTKVVAGTLDWLVQIWDLSTGEEVLVLKGHTAAVQAVSYSPDGTHVTSGSSDLTIRVWGTSTEEEVLVIKGHTSTVYAVSYSPDGTHIISGSFDTTIRVWDASTGEERRVLQGHTSSVRAVSYSPDGTHVVSGSYDKTVRVWDLSTGEARVLEGHADSICAVSYSPDGACVVSGSTDKSVCVWKLSTEGEMRFLKGHTGWVKAVSCSPDGTHVVSGSHDNTVRVWDLSTGEEVRVLQGHSNHVWAVSYSPDGTHVVSGSVDHSIRLWDLSTGQASVHKEHTHSELLAIAYSPDGTCVASGSGDTSVRVLDLRKGEEVKVLLGHTERVNAVAYSPDGTHVVSGSADTSVRVWDLLTGEEASVLRGHAGWVYAVAYSPDGSHVVSGSGDASVRVWELSRGEETKVLRGHTGSVCAVSYSPDATHVASGSYDQTVRVWDLSMGEEVLTLKGHTGNVYAVSYSPDGTRIASASRDKSIRIWELSTGEEVRVLNGHTDWVKALSYSPNGTHVVSGASDNSIRVWDVSTGAQVSVLKGHMSWVNGVAYSPDGTHVVSISHDKSVRMWNASPGHTPRYVREQGPGGMYTGWLVSPTDPSAHLMFVRPDALLPDGSNVFTIPATAVSHVDLSNAKLGDRWIECYSPRSL